MTVPEENRPKTTTTDDAVDETAAESPEEADRADGEGTTLGRELREAMEQADMKREDFEGGS